MNWVLTCWGLLSSSFGVCSGARWFVWEGCVCQLIPQAGAPVPHTHTSQTNHPMCTRWVHRRLHAEASQVAPALPRRTLLHRVCLQPFEGVRPIFVGRL